MTPGASGETDFKTPYVLLDISPLRDTAAIVISDGEPASVKELAVVVVHQRGQERGLDDCTATSGHSLTKSLKPSVGSL